MSRALTPKHVAEQAAQIRWAEQRWLEGHSGSLWDFHSKLLGWPDRRRPYFTTVILPLNGER